MADLKLASDKAIEDVKAGVDELVESLRFDELSQKVTQFGREKPVVLAIAALTVGVAAGLLMRRST